MVVHPYSCVDRSYQAPKFYTKVITMVRIIWKPNHIILTIICSSRCYYLCWFWDDKETPFEEVHHFYGRGRDAGDWREHYTSLGCTCRAHHPQPMKVRNKHQKLEKVVKKLNDDPINQRFKHPNKNSISH